MLQHNKLLLEKSLTGDNDASRQLLQTIIHSNEIELHDVISYCEERAKEPFLNSHAQNMLGVIYMDRLNDEILSLKWFSEAAKQNNRYAISNLCTYYTKYAAVDEKKADIFLTLSSQLENACVYHYQLALRLSNDTANFKINLEKIKIHVAHALKEKLTYPAVVAMMKCDELQLYQESLEFCKSILLIDPLTENVESWRIYLENKLSTDAVEEFGKTNSIEKLNWLILNCYNNDRITIALQIFAYRCRNEYQVRALIELGMSPDSLINCCLDKTKITTMVFQYFTSLVKIKYYLLNSFHSLNDDCVSVIGSYLPWYKNIDI